MYEKRRNRTIAVTPKKMTPEKMIKLSKPSVEFELDGIRADAIEDPATLPGMAMK